MKLLDELRIIATGPNWLEEAIDRGATFYTWSDKPKPTIRPLNQYASSLGREYTGQMYGIPAFTEAEWNIHGITSMRNDQEYVFSFKLKPGLKFLDLDSVTWDDLMSIGQSAAKLTSDPRDAEVWKSNLEYVKGKDRKEWMRMFLQSLTSMGSGVGSKGLRELGYDALLDEKKSYMGMQVLLLRPDVFTDLKLIGGLAAGDVTPAPEKRAVSVPSDVIDALLKYNETAGKVLKPGDAEYLEKNFKPDGPLVVYRGMGWDAGKIPLAAKIFKEMPVIGQKNTYKTTKIQSWSTNPEVAIEFGSSNSIAGPVSDSFGVVLRMKVAPKDVVADLRLLPDSATKQLKFQSQREVLVKPGAYVVTPTKITGSWDVFDPKFSKELAKTLDDLLTQAGKANGLKLAKAFGDYMYSKHLVVPGKKFSVVSVEVHDESKRRQEPGYRIKTAWVVANKISSGMGLHFANEEVKFSSKEELLKYAQDGLEKLVDKVIKGATEIVVPTAKSESSGERNRVRENLTRLDCIKRTLKEITMAADVATVPVPLGAMSKQPTKSESECRAKAEKMFPAGTPGRDKAISDFMKSCTSSVGG